MFSKDLEEQIQKLISEKEAAERLVQQNAIKATEQMATWLQSMENIEKEKLVGYVVDVSV